MARVCMPLNARPDVPHGTYGHWRHPTTSSITPSANCTLPCVYCNRVPQAILSAQAGATLISPFPGRVLEWTRKNVPDGPQTWSPADDPGVVSVRDMYAYLRKFGHDTICMPASWRSSTGNDMLDEVRSCYIGGLAGMQTDPLREEELSSEKGRAGGSGVCVEGGGGGMGVDSMQHFVCMKAAARGSAYEHVISWAEEGFYGREGASGGRWAKEVWDGREVALSGASS
eukprot:365983-Chlamydomonas_euryale.AAC.15